MKPDGKQRLLMMFEQAPTTRVRGEQKRLGKFDLVLRLTPKPREDLFFDFSHGIYTVHGSELKEAGDGDYLEIHWFEEGFIEGREKLHSHRIFGKERGLYLGGHKYPEMCCICCKPVSRYFFYEKRDGQRVAQLIKLDIEEKFQDDDSRTRIIDTMDFDRYWYALPFCDEHSMENGPFISEGKGFKNSEYGKRFAELNNYMTHWVSASEARQRSKASSIALLGFLLIFFPGLFIGLDYLRAGETSIGLVWLIPGAILLLIALIVRITAGRVGNKQDSIE